MIKRKYSILLILSLFLISLSLQSAIFVSGTINTITDPEDDVIMDFFTPGDYFDEIDIVRLDVEDQIGNQIVNLTVAGDLSDWGGYIIPAYKVAEVMLCPNFDYNLYISTGNFTYPYYAVEYKNWTGSIQFDAFFVKHVGKYSSEEYWTGLGYSTDENLAQSIGSGSGSVITANISKTDFEINATTTYFALTTVVTQTYISGAIHLHFYYDIAPENFNPYQIPGSGIPGYDLFIFISSLMGISIIIIIKHKIKSKKK